MKVLITGAGGFVGRYVAQMFASLGHLTYSLSRSKLDLSLLNMQNVHACYGDLREYISLPEACDVVVHCAAALPSRYSSSQELEHVNITSMERLLNWSEHANVRTFVYLSSMSVYGLLQIPEVNENTPVEPNTPYGSSKLQAERLLEQWSHAKQRQGITIRLPAVVGIGSHDNFPSNTLQRMLNSEKVTAFNPSSLYNHVIHIDQLTEFIYLLSQSYEQRYLQVLVGGDKPIYFKEAVEIIAHGTGYKGPVEFKENDAGSPIISFNQAKMLGFKARSVRLTIEEFVSKSVSHLYPQLQKQ